VIVEGSVSGYRADIAVLEQTASWKHGLPPVWVPADPSGLLSRVAEPTIVEIEPPVERWIEIRDGGDKLVTVIEVLSPVNKTSGRKRYVEKRQALIDAGVSVVEIDLLRGGTPTVDDFGPAGRPTPAEGTGFVICVTRCGLPYRREIYRCPLRLPLPVIRVPLRQTDPDVPLDIQSLIDRTYESGRYGRQLHYDQPPDPPLEPADRDWAEELPAPGK